MSQTLTLTQSRGLKYFFFAAIFVSRLVGVINYSYDLKRKKFVLPSKSQHFYCAALHIIYVLILPWALMSSYVREAAFEQKPFYILLNVAITVLRLPALFLTLLGTWLARKNMLNVIYRFEALRLHYFQLLSEAKRRDILQHNDILIYLKLFSSASLIFTFFMRIFIFIEKPSKEFVFYTVYFGILETLSIFKMNFFYCCMCYANCVIRYVRDELFEERHKIQVLRVQELLRIYREVRSLVKEIRNIFQWEILSITLAAMVALIALLFSFIIRWQNFENDEDGEILCTLVLLFGLNAAFVNILDILLIAFVCCNTIKCTRRIRDVLLMINIEMELPHQEELQKELNLLALQFSTNLPYVNVCGLFNLTSAMTFRILKGTLTYLILLVQFDYKNW
ncbi:putative gustatory receptor 58c [Calliphora vicina]|uniref:putative gustatory receptor 58c n=1 Tax=Calliphora vicina TaxID=7373 RepID=UPI00325B5CF2